MEDSFLITGATDFVETCLTRYVNNLNKLWNENPKWKVWKL